MAIIAQCGTCGKQFQVRDEFAGKRFKCKSCGCVVQAPNNDPLAMDPLAMDPLAGFPANQQAPISSATAAQRPPGPQSGGYPAGQSHPIPAPWGGMPQKPAAKRGGIPIWVIAAIGGGVGFLLLGIVLVVVFAMSIGGDKTTVAKKDDANTNTVAESPAIANSPANSSASNSSQSTPTAAEDVVEWQVTADPPQNPVVWPATLDIDIAFPKSADEVLLPTTDSPFAALGGRSDAPVELWNLIDGKQAGTIPKLKLTYASKEYALSPDGKQIAVARSDTELGKVAEIWSFETGELLKKMVCDDKQMSLGLVDFAGPGQLLSFTHGGLDGKYVYRFRVWDIASSKMLHEFYVNRDQTKSSIAFSPGRRYLVSDSAKEFYFFDLQTGKTAGKWSLNGAFDTSASVFGGMNFSPDGKQLGLLYSATNTNLKLIDVATGKLVENIMIAGASNASPSYGGEAIEWLPDGQGWCIKGATIVDATTKRIIWNLELEHINHAGNARRTLPGGWIASDGPYGGFRLTFIAAPWAKIKASVAAFNANGPAHLKPGGSVSLAFDIGTLRFGTPEKTQEFLAAAFTKQFKSADINVADGQPVVMKISYSESAGKELTFQRLGTINKSPNDGKKVIATQALIKMTLQSSDGSKTYWIGDLNLDPTSLITKNDPTEESLRDALLERLPSSFARQPIPFFVPQDDSIATLPGTTVVKKQ